MTKRRPHTSDFVDWIENTIHLPLGLSAEKITIQKSARIGFSTLLSSLNQKWPLARVTPGGLLDTGAIV